MLFVNRDFPSYRLGSQRYGMTFIDIGRRDEQNDRLYRVKIPKSLGSILPEGLHKRLNIDTSDRKKMEVRIEKNDKLHLLLSTRLTDDEGRIGLMYVPKTQTAKIIAQTATVDDNGRWAEYLIEANVGDAFYITYGLPGIPLQRNQFYYIPQRDVVLRCRQGEILERCNENWHIRPKKFPFTVRRSLDGLSSQLDLSGEWRLLHTGADRHPFLPA